MAASGAAFAGQPGRRAGHRHPAADPGHRPQAVGSGTACRLVRACLQPQWRRSGAPGPDTTSALAWAERASLPLGQLADPRVIRAALDGLCTRLDGSPAAASTIARKRAVFHGALGYAVELGLLPANPAGLVRWRAPRAAVAVSPAIVPSPAQVRAILDQVTPIRPELAAFFGCLYYAALRPEEAVALRHDDLVLPARGRGTIIWSAACPRTGTAWTSTGTPHEPRGLKHRADGAIRIVPLPPVLARLLRPHLHAFGTAPDGRLFPGARGGMLSESVYGRAWHAARLAALGPDLAATPLARRPYDLRHAALSLWLNATGEPAEVAARAGNSARVLYEVYLHCTDGQQDAVSQRIEDALDAATGTTHPPPHAKASGYTNRRHHPRPCPLYVRAPGHPRRRSRVQLRTAPSSSRNRRQEHLRRRVPLPGDDPASTTGQDSPAHPACPGSQPPQQACAPAACPRRAFQVLPADPRHRGSAVTTPDQPRQRQTRPIGPGQHENDHDTRAAQAAPSPGSAELSALSVYILIRSIAYSILYWSWILT